MIETVLGNYLCANEQLTTLLASYADDTAIFQQIAPKDTDKLWSGMQFPRLVYDIDKSGDVERKTSGRLFMDVMCCEGSTPPEDIETLLRELIDGYFFVVDGMTYAAKWESTDGFTSEANHKVFGLTVTFSLLAFPLQNTADSSTDTVTLMNTWTRGFFPNATIINVSETEAVFKPTDEAPAIYWSFQGLSQSPLPSIHFCTWIQSNLNMHVIAPSEVVRNTVATQAMQELAAKTRVLFPDKSQYMIHRVSLNMAADPIRAGQMTVQGSYAIVPNTTGAPINNIITKY